MPCHCCLGDIVSARDFLAPLQTVDCWIRHTVSSGDTVHDEHFLFKSDDVVFDLRRLESCFRLVFTAAILVRNLVVPGGADFDECAGVLSRE